MIITTDIASKTWSIDEEELGYSFIEIKFGFRDNNSLPVIFNNLSFGYQLNLDSEKISEDSRPLPGISYVSTDQNFIELFTVSELLIGKEYSLNVWAENNGERWENTFIFFNPTFPKPYESWNWDEDQNMWVSPVPYPNDDDIYIWNEETTSWDKV